jgi:hypothetical protein
MPLLYSGLIGDGPLLLYLPGKVYTYRDSHARFSTLGFFINHPTLVTADWVQIFSHMVENSQIHAQICVTPRSVT